MTLCSATGLPHSPVSNSTISAFPACSTSASPLDPGCPCPSALDDEEGWDEGSKPARAALDNARCHAVILLAYPSGFVCRWVEKSE